PTPSIGASSSHEETIPLMLRPKVSQKECAECIANQLGIKRSQLDPTFYLTGAPIVGMERLSKEAMIGTWTRKQVAAFLKSAFNPLFELLYEEGELPLVFELLIAKGPSQVMAIEPSSGPPQPLLPTKSPQQEPPLSSEVYLPLLSADAEIGLDGFPGEI